MIEVLFGEADAGAMKIAKEKGFIAGNSDSVICLAFMLDIGDIYKSVNSSYRKELIYNMYTQNNNHKEYLDEIKKAVHLYDNEQRRLLDFISEGEPVRIWYSNTAYSMCGLYYVCSLMRNFNNNVSAIKMPDYVEVNNRIIEYKHWGAIIPEKFNDFLIYEKNLSPLLINSYSIKWQELKNDNSPLRANINGEIVGVPEDFYDFIIYKHSRKLGAVREISLIGDMMGNSTLGLGDFLYASRIDFMIKNGGLKIVKDDDIKYKRVICTNNIGGDLDD